MSEAQLGIPGIGQKKVTLSMWKKENEIFTHHAKHLDGQEGENPWTCWEGCESPFDVVEGYGITAFGFGLTEKEAILDYCKANEKKPPFWW